LWCIASPIQWKTTLPARYSQLLHPTDESRPWNAEASRGPIASADDPIGFFQNSQDVRALGIPGAGESTFLTTEELAFK
jgi:hypothetical protein